MDAFAYVQFIFCYLPISYYIFWYSISLLRSSRIALSDFNRPRASSLRWILYTWEERKGLENDQICWNAVGEILWKNENLTSRNKQDILHLIQGKNSACWDSGQFQRFIRRFFSGVPPSWSSQTRWEKTSVAPINESSSYPTKTCLVHRCCPWKWAFNWSKVTSTKLRIMGLGTKAIHVQLNWWKKGCAKHCLSIDSRWFK